jgi:hypothetical protein
MNVSAFVPVPLNRSVPNAYTGAAGMDSGVGKRIVTRCYRRKVIRFTERKSIVITHIGCATSLTHIYVNPYTKYMQQILAKQ